MQISLILGYLRKRTEGKHVRYLLVDPKGKLQTISKSRETNNYTFLTHCWYHSTKFPIKNYNLSWKRVPKDYKFVFCMETCLGKVTATDNLSWPTLQGTADVLLRQSGEVRWQEYSILHPLNLITGSLHQTAGVIQQEHTVHISL